MDEEEHQVRRMKTAMKSISVSMIAKTVAILVSEGISVEGTKVLAEEQSHEISTSCNFGYCLLVLICICFVLRVDHLRFRSRFGPSKGTWEREESFESFEEFREEEKGKDDE